VADVCHDDRSRIRTRLVGIQFLQERLCVRDQGRELCVTFAPATTERLTYHPTADNKHTNNQATSSRGKFSDKGWSPSKRKTAASLQKEDKRQAYTLWANAEGMSSLRYRICHNMTKLTTFFQ